MGDSDSSKSLAEIGILTTGQIAKITQCSMKTVAVWIDTGMLPGYRHPGIGRDRRVKRADLVAFLAAHGMPTIENLLGLDITVRRRTAPSATDACASCERQLPVAGVVEQRSYCVGCIDQAERASENRRRMKGRTA